MVTRKETPPKGSRHNFKLFVQKADQRRSDHDHAGCAGERKAYMPALRMAESTYNKQITARPIPIWVSTNPLFKGKFHPVAAPSPPMGPALINQPPKTTPHKTDSTTETSRKALALTSPAAGTVSVSKPYFAGAYTEAAKPVRAKANKGWVPVHSAMTANNLSKFMTSMTWRF